MIFLLPTDTCYGLAGEFNEQDYNEIYRLKGRDFVKPLAWLVQDYGDLHDYIKITDEQIEILKKYNRPWSILGRRRDDFILPDFLDAKMYDKISLRVARVCLKSLPDKVSSLPLLGDELHRIRELERVTQKGILNSKTPPILPLSREGWDPIPYPLFLTSANLSGKPELTTLSEAGEYFPGIEGYDGGICNHPPSDIFSFGVNNELIYIRKTER